MSTFRLSDGRQLAWEEYGDTSSAKVVVFLHGTPGCRLLPPTLDRQASQGRIRLIGTDRPGFRRSTFSPTRRLVDWPSDLAALADHLGIKGFSVVGYSGGGPYALVSGLALADRIDSIAIVAGVGPLDTPERIAAMPEENRPAYEAAASDPAGAVPIMEAVVALANSDLDTFRSRQKDFLPKPDVDAVAATPELAPFLASMLRECAANGPEGYAYDFWLLTRPWGFEPTSIKVPVRFFHGDLDRNVPIEHARELSGLIEQSTLIVWPGEAHLVGYTRLAEVIAAL